MRRLMVIEQGLLLDQGIKHFLELKPDFYVTGITYVDEIAFLLDVMRLNPQVILMSDAAALDAARLLSLLNEQPLLRTIRVIVICSDRNLIDVYQIKRIVINHSDDLLSVLRSDAGPV